MQAELTNLSYVELVDDIAGQNTVNFEPLSLAPEVADATNLSDNPFYCLLTDRCELEEVNETSDSVAKSGQNFGELDQVSDSL